jgi:hypothetical protein
MMALALIPMLSLLTLLPPLLLLLLLPLLSAYGNSHTAMAQFHGRLGLCYSSSVT